MATVRTRIEIDADARDAVEELTDVERAARDAADAVDGLDAARVTIDVDDAALNRAKQGIDDVGRSASSSKSVLANMVGNATQDLGALGGVAGSAGVAIGQMGEYMADAAADGERLGTILSNFALVAGPIAGISVAMAGVQSIMSDMARGRAAERAFDTEQVRNFTDAIRETDDVARAYADTLETTGQVLAEVGTAAGPAWSRILPGVNQITQAMQGLGLFGSTIENILPTLNKAGISAELWTEIITSPEPVDAMNTLRDALDATTLSADEQSIILRGARAAQDNYAEATANATEVNRFFAAGADEAARAVNRITGALRTAADAQAIVNRITDAVRELAAAAADTTLDMTAPRFTAPPRGSATPVGPQHITIINPPGTPATTVGSSNIYLSRNGVRTEP